MRDDDMNNVKHVIRSLDTRYIIKEIDQYVMNQKFEMREEAKNAVLLIMKKFILTRLKMRILETDIHDTETSN